MARVSPNVFFKMGYHATDSEHRKFYASTQKDDYLDYMDNGITQARKYDYTEYVGDNDKSYGVFDQYGLLSKEDKKLLRCKLREAKGIIWDAIISFKGDYGLKYCDDYESAYELMKDVFPKFLKSASFNPKNVIWYAGLHENTENRHIHISFFEKEPTYFNQAKKEYCYRRGNFKLDVFNELKFNVENHFQNINDKVISTRTTAITAIKEAFSDNPEIFFETTVKKVYKRLFEGIPKTGHVAYQNPSMREFRGDVDVITDYILNHGSVMGPYFKEFVEELDEYSKFREEKAYGYGFNLYGESYKDKVLLDLKRRTGNIVIQNIIDERNCLFKELKEIKDIKLRHQSEADKALTFLLKSAQIAEESDRRTWYEFEEFRRKMRMYQLEEEMKRAEAEYEM